MPQPLRTMKLIASGVTFSAAMTRSPSFSRYLVIHEDDEYRENEGDLVIAADKVTPEAMIFMVRNGCGILGLYGRSV